MNTSENIAKHFREIFFGGNWTCSNVQEQLADINCQEANARIYSFNTIAALAYHIHYYVRAALDVFEGKELNAHDKFSFDHPPFDSDEDWNNFKTKINTDAARLADHIAALPESELWKDFTDAKYGIYYRNLHGIIEHSHYHLGQIALIKKLAREKGI